jgi:glutaredoxin
MDNEPIVKKRRINGLIVFGILAVTILIFTFRFSASKVSCTDEIMAQKPDVIMLSAWWCPYCHKARNYLLSNDISYCEYDMEHSKEGKKLYEEAGGRGIPVLLIGNQQINGFDEQSIEIALSELHAS